MNLSQAITQLSAGQSLNSQQMTTVMHAIMTGEANDAQIAGFLVALKIKGETVEEITAAVKVMRELMQPVAVTGNHLVDIVGTGGDNAHLFNVSTASAFVAAIAGARVAKHGNRSVSSSSGAADLLQAAGVKLDLTSEEIARCINHVGIGFMFAPQHHPAIRHAMPARKALAIRTMFNLLGPLTNPAQVTHQLVGVFDRRWLQPVAAVLRNLGSKHVLVVHAADGLDEISIASETWVAELKGQTITEYTVTPEQFGIERSDLSSLKVTDAKQSLALIKQVLSGSHDNEAATHIVALNAGAAIYVANKARDWAEGVAIAQDILASGQAGEKLKELAQVTQMIINARKDQ